VAERDERFGRHVVVEGEGQAMVEVVGATTRLARLSPLTQAVTGPAPVGGSGAPGTAVVVYLGWRLVQLIMLLF
jgi:hypothetical protein